MLDLGEPMFNYNLDVFEVADYFLYLDSLRAEPDVTPMKLAKLLYLTQANYLASTSQRMFNEQIEAFEHGPVVYREHKRHPGRQIIVTRTETPATAVDLPEDVANFVDAVWARYRDYSAAELRKLTHDQAPWRENYYEGSFRAIIPDQEMTDYFRQHVPARERVFHPNVTVVPSEFFTDADADDFAAKVAEYTGP